MIASTVYFGPAEEADCTAQISEIFLMTSSLAVSRSERVGAENLVKLAVFEFVRFNKSPSDWYPESSEERRLKFFGVGSDELARGKVFDALCAGAQISRFAIVGSGVVVGETTPVPSFLTYTRRRDDPDGRTCGRLYVEGVDTVLFCGL